jgi:hypothetical protein
MDSADGAPRDTPEASGSGSHAESSAAHIAELVRRSAERDAQPGPSSVAVPDKTIALPVTAPPAAQPSAQPVTELMAPVTQRVKQPGTEREAQPVTQRMAQPLPQPGAQPLTQRVAQLFTQRGAKTGTVRVGPASRQPPVWGLVAGGAVAIVLIATGIALSQPSSSPATPLPLPAAPGKTVASASVVRATDVITDCASHSHGRTRTFFRTQNCVKATRSLTTGQVNGRQVLFVVSRVEMASPEAATGIKHVLDANDTGNLNDLLREGRTYPGSPAAMPNSGYASVRRGTVVLVAEAGYVDGGASSDSDPALRAAAARMANR